MTTLIGNKKQIKPVLREVAAWQTKEHGLSARVQAPRRRWTYAKTDELME